MPFYDFECRTCHRITEVMRSMSEAGLPVTCSCGGETRRIYDTNVMVVMRPSGYSLPVGHPDYWKGFDDPLPTPLRWQKGARANPDCKAGVEYDGAGSSPQGDTVARL